MHELVMNHPRCKIAYPKLTFQRLGRETCLRLADHIDRLKPDGERQLGGFKTVPAVSVVWWRQFLN